MTLEQLKYFRTAAQLGNFSKAAETEHISQPSLSVSIKKLEKELGVNLFLPNRRGAILTEAGRLFLQDVQNVFQQLDIATTHMAQFSHKDKAEVQLAYTSSVADVYIPRLLKSFLTNGDQQYCVYSDEMPTDQISQGIREGRFELGIGSELPPDPEIEQIPLQYQPLCLLLPQDATSSNTFSSIQELNNVPFISYRKDYPMYRLLSSLFQRWGVQPHITHYTYSETAIARLVEQNLGVSIVPATEGLQNYRVQLLQPNWLTEGRYLYLIKHRTRILSTAAEALQEHIMLDAQQKQERHSL